MRLFRSRPALALLGITASLSFLLNALPQVTLAGQAAVGNRGGFPGRRIGGGSRGDCVTNAPLVALSPKTNFGRTTAAYPTLYFSTPSTNKSLQLKFILKDEAGNTLAKREFVMEQTSGILGIDLSKVAQTPLNVNQTYHWYLSAACGSPTPGQNLIVDGWIQRIDQAAQTPPPGENSLSPERIRQAWKAGLWYDAIAALIQLQQSQPSSNPTTALWKEMLQAEELNQAMVDMSLTTISSLPSR